MNMEKEYTINGKRYVLAKDQPEPVKPKRKPITAWASVYSNREIYFYPTKQKAEEMVDGLRLECVQLHEIPEGAIVITQDEFAKKWDESLKSLNFIAWKTTETSKNQSAEYSAFQMACFALFGKREAKS